MSPEISPALARRITTNDPRQRSDTHGPVSGPHVRPPEAPTAVSSRPLARSVDAQRLSLAAISQALDMTPDAVFFFSPELRIVEANEAAIRITGYRRGELQLQRLDEVLAKDGECDWQAGIMRVVRGEELGQSLPALLRSKDGQSSPVRFEVQIVHDPAGSLLVAVVHCRRDERDVHALLSRPRHFDYLTELPTRSALEYRLRRAERQSRRQRSRFAVLFLDLDRFKEINDLYGHRVGDAVLRAFAARLNACVRPGDFVARYGGDEFVLLVEDVGGEEEVQCMADRLQTELAASLEVGKTSLAISVSMGMAIGHAGSSAESLVDEADRAMYAAKRARR
ncbi:MAG: GGDEF domain-containing protein [Pirellulales bacterium]